MFKFFTEMTKKYHWLFDSANYMTPTVLETVNIKLKCIIIEKLIKLQPAPL